MTGTPGRKGAARHSRGPARALHSEWTKARTVAGTPGLLAAAAGSVLYLALIALLSLGIAVMIRDSAAAIGVVLGLLYLPPLIAAVLASNPQWQHRIERYAPMNAGLTIQDTTGLHNLPISPWAGLGVLAIWAAAALLTGGLMLRLRDA